MGALETGLIYGLIGFAVAAALVLREQQGGMARRVVLFAGGWLFWPLFAPLLLGGTKVAAAPPVRAAARISGAQAQLLHSLEGAGGLADAVAPEVARVRGLAGAVAAMERRADEMGALLATPEFDLAAARGALTELLGRGVAEGDPRAQSVRARLRNIERLVEMRQRTLEDLERIALKVEEMGSRLQLLRFAGRPDAEVVELFKEVAQSVEEISEGLLAAG